MYGCRFSVENGSKKGWLGGGDLRVLLRVQVQLLQRVLHGLLPHRAIRLRGRAAGAGVGGGRHRRGRSVWWAVRNGWSGFGRCVATVCSGGWSYLELVNARITRLDGLLEHQPPLLGVHRHGAARLTLHVAPKLASRYLSAGRPKIVLLGTV